jgi:tetratricopeptide (TPR) repeat protein
MAAIVQDMMNKGLVGKDQGRLILTAPLAEIDPGIPDTLQQMLETQFERLSPEEQRVLQSGSVAGERFSVWAVAAMLEASPASIEEACDRLANRQLFIRSSGVHAAPNGSAAAHYEFRHSLYRQALYRRISGLNRSRLHLSVGELLMPLCTAGKPELASELALHFEEGRDYGQATRYLMLTAENATRRFSHRDAIQILLHALELVPALAPGTGLEPEIQILQRIGDLRFTLGEMSDSAASYEKAADRAAEAGLKVAQVGALARLAFPAWYLDPARGSEVSAQALEVSRDLTDPLLVAQTQLAAASFRLLYDSWRKEDEETCARADETIRRLGGSSIPQNVFYICVQLIQGDYQEALRQAEALIATTTNPIVRILGLTTKALILLPCGRFGEVLRLVRTGTELAEKNGEDPWIHIYCEAWLRTLCSDFDGVRRLSEIIMRSNAEQHALRARTIATVAAGYAELQQGNYDKAWQCFAHVRDFRTTPKFFLHWHWRLHAELGATEARLSAGDLENARREADGFLGSALSIADPNMRALAWEMKSRVAGAEKDYNGAKEYIHNALAILDRFHIPVAAWRVHATAWDFYSYAEEHERAEGHRTRAKELIMRIADSFERDEPLRELLLAAPPVRHLFGEATSA